MKTGMVVASMVCVLAGSTTWAEEGAPPGELETPKRMMQEVISENLEPKVQVLELEAAASADEAGFKPSEQSLDNLRQEWPPSEILEKLEALKGQNFSQAQNRALAKRRAGLEAAQNAGAQKQEEAESQFRRVAVESSELKRLEERVKVLEAEKAAREEATRSIIRQALSTLGSQINQFVALGGNLEMTTGRIEDYSGLAESLVELSTAELHFDIQVNEWTFGSLKVEHIPGATNVLFPTTTGFQTGDERIAVDTAEFTIGDRLKFPPYMHVGRVILPFGISTGDPVADVPNIEGPLTVEAFEFRKAALGFGLGFPTPPLAPATPPVIVPPVKPVVISPLVRSLSRLLGYAPPPKRLKPPTPFIPAPAPPPFHAGFYFYDGNTSRGPRLTEHFDASVGFRTRGHCGRPYDQLGADEQRGWLGVFCPWAMSVDVDYNSSVFRSRFLEPEYDAFHEQIGLVPGMSGNLKATLGPVALVGEWNGAIKRAKFFDALGPVNIMPAAWQVSLAYQFDWNPWVESIGAQGTYLAIGYSESRNLAGVTTQDIAGDLIRVGFLPRKRLVLTLGEWVLDGLRVAVEFARQWDYSKNEGGTGNFADGAFAQLTYTW